ncbi:invasion protein CiaB [Campylobacter sp. MIT 21-1685]|uniref:invasion protein CiaB n=1 Tax=unclassified Campylobacter TaxID=2593542 RepID=UPI00224AB7E9|nr:MULTISPECIES: invasion protein CiaB [unclassified Campylobacter]MCX2682824.1 invasion protein CiaB [Campylobacter sp. MIT 21-1684]MCX2751030.1 invasion protein CiaB [Campylobacter sp. MIT 21-1682]MCX2807305.1 invasion protein CiaB [Campylobacter sp. MIT 21-1685]
MNNFKELSKMVAVRNKKFASMYDILENNLSNECIDNLIKISTLKPEKNVILAALRRLIDLKEENFVKELEKKHLKEEQIIHIKHLLYDEVCRFYEKEHQEFINEIKEKKVLNEFYQTLIQGVHNIGLVMNAFEKVWTREIIEKNNKILDSIFPSLDEALQFLSENGLYQREQNGQMCERSYGVLVRIGNLWRFVSYAVFFENEILKLEFAFDSMLNSLRNLACNEDELAYIEYFTKLKAAFCEKENDRVIAAWQEAELAWLKVKSPLQVGHPLEYYEDSYTHAVALEWDLRLQDERNFDSALFIKEMKESFLSVCKHIDIENVQLQDEVCMNIERTQLYICNPVIFYGAELKGLFSAQVVPNDEFVSKQAGKKIFAFLNFVYENTKSKPFMQIATEVFDKEFLTYGREILFHRKEIWKKVYEISTLGHEFGHIFFTGENTEKNMNKSGFFKNIEEYKATVGGLIHFFYHEKEELRLPVFHDLIKRAVGLIAWQRVDEVKAYYTEGLIHLTLLFESGALSFQQGSLKVDFSLCAYEKFKNATLQNYYQLAKHYILQLDAKDFLSRFCVLENGLFLPILPECKAFVEFYYDLYEKIGNKLDESGEFEKYKKTKQ